MQRIISHTVRIPEIMTHVRRHRGAWAIVIGAIAILATSRGLAYPAPETTELSVRGQGAPGRALASSSCEISTSASATASFTVAESLH